MTPQRAVIESAQVALSSCARLLEVTLPNGIWATWLTLLVQMAEGAPVNQARLPAASTKCHKEMPPGYPLGAVIKLNTLAPEQDWLVT